MDELVTVYMPTRDRAPLAARAIESVLNQSWQALELIVVDDGSRPENLEWLTARFPGETRLQFARQPESRGASAARNRALDLAGGHFVTGLDDDDTFAPNRLECFVEAWSTDNADGRYAALFTAQRYGDRQSRMVPVIDYDDLLSGNYIGNQVFTLTARLKDIGGFDEALPAMQDYETWLRLTKRYGPVLGLPEATYLVDIDHTLGRVSEKDVATLRAAYAHIVKVHNLDPRAQRRLKSVLFSYPQVPMSLLDLAEQWRLGNYGQSSRTWLAKKLGMQR